MSRLVALAVAVYCVGCASATKPCASAPRDVSHGQEAMIPPAANAAVGGDDPTVSDPDKYKAVMENARVRVLRYHDEPGAKTHPHHHPESVLYALSAFRRRLTFPDGTTKDREFKPGDVMWLPAQTHVGENTGTTDTEVLLVEMKSK